MNDSVKDKIAKVLELVNRGKDGEQLAAKNALQRLMKKYNIPQKELDKIYLKEYGFKYSTQLDMYLMLQLVEYFLGNKNIEIYKETWGKREILIKLEYLDWVTIETAWGYFKPHMNKEWRKFAKGKLNRYRKQSNKNKRREQLQEVFFSQYILKSGIYHSEQVVKRKSMSLKEFKDLCDAENIEGGNYKKQVDRGLYLE